MAHECFYCGDKKNKNHLGIHRFPFSDTDLLKKWLQNMNLGPNVMPTASSILCSKHFTNDCLIETDEDVALKPGSVPTIFDGYKYPCTYCKSRKTVSSGPLYKFPLRKPELLEKWITAAGLKNISINAKSRLCSKHFDPSSFQHSSFLPLPSNRYLYLKGTAVPSIFDSTIPEMVDFEELLAAKEQEQYCDTNPALKGAPPTRHPNLSMIALSDHEYTCSPEKMWKDLSSAQLKVKVLQQNMRSANQRIRRLKTKVKSLKDTVKRLRGTSNSVLRSLDGNSYRSGSKIVYSLLEPPQI